MIQIRDLKKSYGNHQVLRGLSMQIETGELFGLIGPDGAGKTTAMKIVAGLLRADAGEIMINGKNQAEYGRGIKKKIGYVPDFFGVYDNLKVQEYMEFYASLYGMGGREARKKSEELLEIFGIMEWKEEMADSMSREIKQKLCVARALVNDPKILVLDEPSSCMEPKARKELKELLQELCAEGKTVLISSHDRKELAEICTSIGFISDGKLLMQGNIQELLARQRMNNPFVIKFLTFPEEAAAVLKSSAGVKNLAKKENSVSFHFSESEEEVAALLAQMVAAGARILSFHREEGNLESIEIGIPQSHWL